MLMIFFAKGDSHHERFIVDKGEIQLAHIQREEKGYNLSRSNSDTNN